MEKRPYVSINMAITADGKITDRASSTIGGVYKPDRKKLDYLRSINDAVIIGRHTLQSDNPFLKLTTDEYIQNRIKKGMSPHPIGIVVSNSCIFTYNERFFHNKESRKIVITNCSSQSNLEILKNKVEIIHLDSEGQISAGKICSTLYEMGIRNLMVEGGGNLNFTFVEEKLVDEVYLTVEPMIVGGETAKTAVEGNGLLKKDALKLKLLECNQSDDFLFLRYKVIG